MIMHENDACGAGFWIISSTFRRKSSWIFFAFTVLWSCSLFSSLPTVNGKVWGKSGMDKDAIEKLFNRKYQASRLFSGPDTSSKKHRHLQNRISSTVSPPVSNVTSSSDSRKRNKVLSLDVDPAFNDIKTEWQNPQKVMKDFAQAYFPFSSNGLPDPAISFVLPEIRLNDTDTVATPTATTLTPSTTLTASTSSWPFPGGLDGRTTDVFNKIPFLNRNQGASLRGKPADDRVQNFPPTGNSDPSQRSRSHSGRNRNLRRFPLARNQASLVTKPVEQFVLTPQTTQPNLANANGPVEKFLGLSADHIEWKEPWVSRGEFGGRWTPEVPPRQALEFSCPCLPQFTGSTTMSPPTQTNPSSFHNENIFQATTIVSATVRPNVGLPGLGGGNTISGTIPVQSQWNAFSSQPPATVSQNNSPKQLNANSDAWNALDIRPLADTSGGNVWHALKIESQPLSAFPQKSGDPSQFFAGSGFTENLLASDGIFEKSVMPTASGFDGQTTTPPQWQPFIPHWGKLTDLSSLSSAPNKNLGTWGENRPSVRTDSEQQERQILPQPMDQIWSPLFSQTTAATSSTPGFSSTNVFSTFTNSIGPTFFPNTKPSIDTSNALTLNPNKAFQTSQTVQTNDLPGFNSFSEDSLNIASTPISTSSEMTNPTASWSYSYPSMNAYQPTTPLPFFQNNLPSFTGSDPFPFATKTSAETQPQNCATTGAVKTTPVRKAEAVVSQPPINVDIYQPVRRIMSFESFIPICAQPVVRVIVDGSSQPGTVFGTVLAVDPGANPLNFTIDSDPLGIFAVDRNLGEFRLARNGSLKGISSTDVLVRATNPAGQSCVTLVRLIVARPEAGNANMLPSVPIGMSENHEAGGFQQDIYTATISCALPKGTFILRAPAKGAVRYQLKGTNEFSVSKNGSVFAKDLDIGNKDFSRSFEIKAFDSQGREVSAVVKILLDITTCYGPQFDMSTYLYDVSTDCSGIQPGDRIAQITALPPSPVSKLTYGLVGSLGFIVEPSTGVITSENTISGSQRIPDFGIVVKDLYDRSDTSTVRITATINCTRRIAQNDSPVEMADLSGGVTKPAALADFELPTVSSNSAAPKDLTQSTDLGRFGFRIPCGAPRGFPVGTVEPAFLEWLGTGVRPGNILSTITLVNTPSFAVSPFNATVYTTADMPSYDNFYQFRFKADGTSYGRGLMHGSILVHVSCNGFVPKKSRNHAPNADATSQQLRFSHAQPAAKPSGIETSTNPFVPLVPYTNFS